MRITNRVARAVAALGVGVLGVGGLAACGGGGDGSTSSPDAGTASHGTTTPADAAGESAAPEVVESPSEASPSLAAIDMCQWVDWETWEAQMVLIQGPPDNTAALPVVASDGFLQGRIGPESIELTCRIPVDGVGEYVGHEATTAFRATLVADPSFEFVADADAPRPFTSQALAHGTHAVAVSVEDGTFTLELESGVYLVLTIDSMDSRLNDMNVPSLSEIAGPMADAWDAGRVPTFSSPSEYAADVVGLCRSVLGEEDLEEVLVGQGPLALTATGERDWHDGVSTPSVTCEYASAAAAEGDAPSVRIDLSWAPSVDDASLRGGESVAGCVASDGMLVSCQPGWVWYATVTGRWLVETEYRDPAVEADLAHEKFAEAALQNAVVELGDALTVNASRMSVQDDADRGRDPRAVLAETLSVAPSDAECPVGNAVRGVETARVAAHVCDAQDGTGAIVGTLDGNPFVGDTFALYPACGFVTVTGGPKVPVLMCISDGVVEMMVEGDSAEYIGREYVDSAWYLGTLGP